jgi:hypothetical protein
VLAYTREAAALYPETAEFADYLATLDAGFAVAQSRAMHGGATGRRARDA